MIIVYLQLFVFTITNFQTFQQHLIVNLCTFVSGQMPTVTHLFTSAFCMYSQLFGYLLL